MNPSLSLNYQNTQPGTPISTYKLPTPGFIASMTPEQRQRQSIYANEMGVDFAQVVFPQTARYSQLLAPGYAGYRIYDTARQTYRHTGDIRETLKETGDATLFHLIATIGIPLLISTIARKYIKAGLLRLSAPKWAPRHAGALSILLSGGLLAALTQPVNNMVGALLDRYYRPWAKLQALNEIQASNSVKNGQSIY